MTTYNRKTFRKLILSKDPDKIDEGMELLKSTLPKTIEAIFAEVRWDVMDEHALYERLKKHAYLTLYLLGVMHEFEVKWVVKLECLELLETELCRLPDILGNLTNLTELIVSDDKLTSLPQSMNNLTNLSFHPEGTAFESLPTQLVGLGVKKELWDRFQTQIYNMKSLKELSFDGLTQLPETIGNLTDLKGLNFSFCHFTTLPDSFKNLTNLTSLDLGSTHCTTLPDWIGNLTNLSNLWLYDNQLTTLPESFGNLTNLTGLNLYVNQLTTLPDSIGNLTNLKKLDLKGNPISAEAQEHIKSLLPNCDIRWFY